MDRVVGKRRKSTVEDELAAAEARLRGLVALEVEDRAAEVQRTLARARADSISLLQDEERRILEETRQRVLDYELALGTGLTDSLIATQKHVEKRLSTWAEDLERAQQTLAAQLMRLQQRQEHLISEAEARITAESERLTSESEEQHVGVARLRTELERQTQGALSAVAAELETHAAERRRALHEVGERLRRRERELKEQIEREQAEASTQIASRYADVERRAVEQLERVLNREAARFAEAAAQQFDASIKLAREEAARRLSRELDRAVSTFSREAERVLAEQMAQVTDAAVHRIERRVSQIAAGLERQRDEAVAELEQRLREVSMQVDDTAARARERFAALD
jgi:hypothetical protein